MSDSMGVYLYLRLLGLKLFSTDLHRQCHESEGGGAKFVGWSSTDGTMGIFSMTGGAIGSFSCPGGRKNAKDMSTAGWFGGGASWVMGVIMGGGSSARTGVKFRRIIVNINAKTNNFCFIFSFIYLPIEQPERANGCVITCVWAGVDNVWEQEKLEARKMLADGVHTTRQVHTLLACVIFMNTALFR